jgi:hypothetical protein
MTEKGSKKPILERKDDSLKQKGPSSSQKINDEDTGGIVRFDTSGEMPQGKVVTESTNKPTSMKNTNSK